MEDFIIKNAWHIIGYFSFLSVCLFILSFFMLFHSFFSSTNLSLFWAHRTKKRRYYAIPFWLLNFLYSSIILIGYNFALGLSVKDVVLAFISLTKIWLVPVIIFFIYSIIPGKEPPVKEVTPVIELKDDITFEKAEEIKQIIENAENGNADAQFEVAVMLCEGHWMPKDKNKAELWCKRAVEQGHLQARLLLKNF